MGGGGGLGGGAVGDGFGGFDHFWEEVGLEGFLGDDAAGVAGLEEFGRGGFGLGFAGVIDDDAHEGGGRKRSSWRREGARVSRTKAHSRRTEVPFPVSQVAKAAFPEKPSRSWLRASRKRG